MKDRKGNVTPNLPTVGDERSIFGLPGKVTIVEPYSDWAWNVEIEVQMGASKDVITLTIPTDVRTDDGARIFA